MLFSCLVVRCWCCLVVEGSLLVVWLLVLFSCLLFVGSAAKVKGAQTPRKSACKEPRIQAVLTVKIGGSLHKAGKRNTWKPGSSLLREY